MQTVMLDIPFLFQIGSIKSAPEEDGEDDFPSFYSKLVRLKDAHLSGSRAAAYWFLFQIGSIKRRTLRHRQYIYLHSFYSKLVRLKAKTGLSLKGS